ncbi:hypothetical protein SK128_007676, partial [Halocaridina rubra]
DKRRVILKGSRDQIDAAKTLLLQKVMAINEALPTQKEANVAKKKLRKQQVKLGASLSLSQASFTTDLMFSKT